MENLSSIDKNFAAQTADDMVWFDISEKPELIYGLKHDAEGFYRMEEDIAKKVNESTHAMCTCTSGGRIRFITDSKVVSVKARLAEYYPSANMTLLGSAGFDMYERRDNRWIYRGCFPPSEDGDLNLEAALVLPDEGEHELLIHFPIHAQVKKLMLGLAWGCSARPFAYLRNEKILYYGSSITQGGCASRPGLSYSAIISRMLDMDYINLGFSSGAHAEETMLDYLSGCKCDLMILDYDHNAPNAEFLEKTHGNMYRKIRASHPQLPLILASAPVSELMPGNWDERRDIILKTYEDAVAAGDKKLCFIDGSAIFKKEIRENCMIDQWHPNDIGMQFMAEAFAAAIRQLLG